MAKNELQLVLRHAQKLSPDEQLELIKMLAEKLARANVNKKPQYLVFGKYHNATGKMSSEEDFKIAEWRPTEAELNGD